MTDFVLITSTRMHIEIARLHSCYSQGECCPNRDDNSEWKGYNISTIETSRTKKKSCILFSLPINAQIYINPLS